MRKEIVFPKTDNSHYNQKEHIYDRNNRIRNRMNELKKRDLKNCKDCEHVTLNKKGNPASCNIRTGVCPYKEP